MKVAIKPERNVVVVPESMQQAMARLLFIDGLRAVAICIVVFNHAWSWTNHNSIYVTRVLGGSIEFLFVISGFCLFLPMVRDEHQSVRTLDLKRYVRRRFARIYPSYLAGLALSVGVLYMAYKFNYHAGYVNYADLYPWSADSCQSLLAHLTMAHALFPQFCFSINFSYWVLSIEWQLYVIYPILMFVAKRFSLKAALIVPFAVAIIARLVEKFALQMPMGTWSAANMVSLIHCSSFGAGMVAAAIVANKIKPRLIMQSQTRLFCLTMAISSTAIYCEIIDKLSLVRPMIWAIAAGLWFVYLGSFEGKLKRVLSLPLVAWMGRISYSWYIVHWSVLVMIGIAASYLGAGPWVVGILGPLASVPLAYCFYSILERPFSSAIARVIVPNEKLETLPGCAQ